MNEQVELVIFLFEFVNSSDLQCVQELFELIESVLQPVFIVFCMHSNPSNDCAKPSGHFSH